jgi:hypothetical protein
MLHFCQPVADAFQDMFVAPFIAPVINIRGTARPDPLSFFHAADFTNTEGFHGQFQLLKKSTRPNYGTGGGKNADGGGFLLKDGTKEQFPSGPSH